MIRLCVLVSLFAMMAFVAAPVAHATVHKYDADLSGPHESPPNASPGTGFTEVDYDDLAHTLKVHVDFSGLLGTTTASHIHAPTVDPFLLTAGVATTTPTFAGFPLGVTSGTYDNTLDLTLASSYNPAFVTAQGGTTASAEAALVAAIAAGKSYLNIHTTVVPGGEIRGFLIPAVPEPSTVVLLAMGAAGIGFVARRRS
jgi:CHRD domain/PEP-CTERM motif